MGPDTLRERDRKILLMIDRGANTQQIADSLFISKWSVRDAVQQMKKALGAPAGMRQHELPGFVRELERRT